MTATTREPDIPGTTLFDGTMTRKGYALNKMCYSFNQAANRDAFVRDEAAYFAQYGLAAETLTQEDWDAIDAAFASNNDPVVGVPATKAFRELFRHLTAIMPPPYGVGPEAAGPA